MQAHFATGGCRNLAGEAKIANTWEMLNNTNPEEGLKVFLNKGKVNGQNSTVAFVLKCDKNMTDGKFILINLLR